MYRVTRKYAARGSESPVGNFKDLAGAKAEIKKWLADDARMKVQTIYCLYEGYDLVEEFDQSHLSEEANSSSSQGQSSTQSYRPTPLPTAPRPPGMPASAWSREENDKDK